MAAEAAPEAVAVVPARLCDHLLSLEDLSGAAGATAAIAGLARDRGRVQRHGLGRRLVAVSGLGKKHYILCGNFGFILSSYPVAVQAVDFGVGAVGKVAGVQLVFAVVASEALLVVEGVLCNLLLSFEDFAVASVNTYK